MEMKKILVPTDGSEDNQKALETAKKMAEKFNAQIILLNIVPPYNEYAHQTMYHYAMLMDMNVLEKQSKELLEEIKKGLKDIEVKTISVVGHPADKILSIAEEEKADLIIMATHGMSKMKRYLIGSVTNNVVHHSKIPVLVIP